jgi:hypothetical protein
MCAATTAASALQSSSNSPGPVSAYPSGSTAVTLPDQTANPGDVTVPAHNTDKYPGQTGSICCDSGGRWIATFGNIAQGFAAERKTLSDLNSQFPNATLGQMVGYYVNGPNWPGDITQNDSFKNMATDSGINTNDSNQLSSFASIPFSQIFNNTTNWTNFLGLLAKEEGANAQYDTKGQATNYSWCSSNANTGNRDHSNNK